MKHGTNSANNLKGFFSEIMTSASWPNPLFMILRKRGRSTFTQLNKTLKDFFKRTRENSIFPHAVLNISLKIFF